MKRVLLSEPVFILKSYPQFGDNLLYSKKRIKIRTRKNFGNWRPTSFSDFVFTS